MERHALVEELPIHATANEAFSLFQGQPFSFFLDSGTSTGDLGRYSFVGSNPFVVLKSRGTSTTLTSSDGTEQRKVSPFDILGELLEKYAMEPSDPDTPFAGGALGYFAYDLCHLIENVPSHAVDDLHLPECCLAFYDLTLTFDHRESRVYVASTGFPEMEEKRRARRAAERIRGVRAWLADALRRSRLHHTAPGEGTVFSHNAMAAAVNLRSDFSRQDYIKAVETAREYIAAGQVFQVNLSQRFNAELQVTPYELYQRLRHINPAPFAAYLDFDDVTIVSASPERFLKMNGDHVQTRPMKGTRRRGACAAEDESLARELASSPKDRAENTMIVDLERNDFGKVCDFGTVRVKELCEIEKYATVFQLTSTVEGRLSPGKSRIDLLKACFPGGSVTGAPKVKAMAIIDELEPTTRSIYTGAIGYLGFGGAMDLSIAIRTCLVREGMVYFKVGGAVTYDSDPETEYEETMDKARALLMSLGLSPHTAVLP